ncbi:YhzD family protein [Siminovitchia fortis]|uniref:YhzD-like protein n=1 Tax=Siminovitchia fortis TaxID=254758 RepID=A0A443J1U5_9BACI|nr:YhzD family protein [Siminovitchia fortis]RWR14601.1 hypothetical protein D4N35_002130 [Siminovitchia fortis]WHY80282.1 YhzD family protein [Siminovitchia fortis]
MGIYKLTAFEPTGEKLLDEGFEAADDREAKEKGTAILSEKGLLNRTHRCSSPAGKLVLFHR